MPVMSNAVCTYWLPLSILALLALWGFPRYHPRPKNK